ncbi:MAG: metal-sensitive transcriptional regulator [Chloroflexi bacterium]|nr:metal-sensitive transcriptional regulator [Chloroflexota bacterium]
MASYCCDKQDILQRLRAIEEQVRAAEEMVAEDRYCVDVLDRLASANAAAQEVGMIVLQDHIQGCVRQSLTTDGRDNAIKELVEVLERFM